MRGTTGNTRAREGGGARAGGLYGGRRSEDGRRVTDDLRTCGGGSAQADCRGRGRFGRGGAEPDQRGGGTGLTLAIAVVLLAVAVVGAWQVAWLACGARARSVADLVALAAAGSQQAGEPACAAAERAAVRNHAVLTSCEVLTGWGEFVVDVRVEVPVAPRVAGAPEVVGADSRAGVVSDVGAR